MRSKIPSEVVWIFVSVSGLTGIGLLALSHVQPVISLSGEDLFKQFFTKQLVFLGAGLAAMLVVLMPHYVIFRRLAYPAYGACLVAVVMLIFLGRTVNGAKSWFVIGPISIQPAEFMKLGLVLALARFMMYQKNIETVRGLSGPFLLTAVPLLLILKQPDLGTAMIFFPVLLVMVYAAGARRRHLAAVLIATIIFVPLAYKLVLKPYQQERLSAWALLLTNPDEAPKDRVYHQLQSIRATAVGGLTGTGLGESAIMAPIHVPERQTDFIFTVIAEELGLFGCNVVLVLFALFFYNALKIAYNTREPFGRLLVVGAVSYLAVQVVINISVCVGLAPVTGLTLPFLSYGGSSLLTSFIAAALIMNVGLRWVPTFADRDFRFDDREIRSIGTRWK